VSTRVTFPYKGPGDTRDGAWLTTFFTDLRTVTGTLGDRNVREEALRLRHFDAGVVAGDPVPAVMLGTDAKSPGPTLVAQQAFGALPAAVHPNLAGAFTLSPGEMLRVRASLQMPYTVVGPVPGCEDGSRCELQIYWTRDGVPEADVYSPVWIEHGQGGGTQYMQPILTTFGTYYNNTGSDIAFTNITVQFQNNAGRVPTDAYVDNVRLEADKFRKV
jgi:hypothetical protein